MDWIKVKTKHIFHDGFNKTNGWSWIKLMGLVAEIEDLPNERQMLSVVTETELNLLQNHFKAEGKLLQNILEAVLKDVQTIKTKREFGKERQRKYREKYEVSRVTSPLRNEADKIREDKIREDKIREDKRESSATRFTPPTHKEISDYCTEKNITINPDRFIDFYTSKGWLVGKNKMKDWKAAVRNWAARDNQQKGGNTYGHSKLDRTIAAGERVMAAIDQRGTKEVNVTPR